MLLIILERQISEEQARVRAAAVGDADEIVQLGWESDLPNQIQLNQDLRAWQRSVSRGLAVKLRHRREVLESLGLSDLAASDAERIKQLGFDREEILF